MLSKAGFPYIACRTFTKNKERRQNFKETEDSRCIYQNEIDKIEIYQEQQRLKKCYTIKRLLLLTT